MLISALEGDGVNLSFFQFLWSKCGSDQEGKYKLNHSKNTLNQDETTIVHGNEKCTSTLESNNCFDQPIELNVPQIYQDLPNLRIPDTIVFQYGQPYNWYFTSLKGTNNNKRCRPTILRKRRQNLSMEMIEREFVKRCRVDHGGKLDQKRDIIAYFVASADCTNRRHQSDLKETRCEEKPTEELVDCDIEYLNSDDLHDFLFHKRNRQSGILQRFLNPVGGTHNSQIRVIWTPNLCLVERRKTNHSLNDIRYGLYERAVTFDGPDIYSSSIPVRGTILARQLKTMCDALAQQFTNVSKCTMPFNSTTFNHIEPCTVSNYIGGKKVSRMVVHFKMDSHDRIWLLYSSSIRLADPDGSFPMVVNENVRPVYSQLPWTHANDKMSTSQSSPMNISNIIKLPPTIQLNQNANHNRSVITKSLAISLLPCISCAQRASNLNFQNVTYKTIVSHYDHAMKMFKSSPNYVHEWHWPPKREFIIAAGGVGFGPILNTTVQKKQNNNRLVRHENDSKQLLEEDLVIPPIIRYLHPRLRVEGYQRYRTDPLFLHKTCLVCEKCFLSYANLVTSSYQMIRPIQLYKM